MTTSIRVGWGVDAHRFDGSGPVVIAGVEITADRGVAAHSDGDVAIHALCDALLGAAALEDLGAHFPETEEWRRVPSTRLLARVVTMLADAGYAPAGADVTVVSESVRVAPHRPAMRESLAEILGLPVERVSVKATTTDGLGFIGRDEGLAAFAAVTVQPVP